MVRLLGYKLTLLAGLYLIAAGLLGPAVEAPVAGDPGADAHAVAPPLVRAPPALAAQPPDNPAAPPAEGIPALPQVPLLPLRP
jgi:hypothetical protein